MKKTVKQCKPRPLTPRQLEVYKYITEYINKNHYSPSLEEIATKLKIKIPSVHQHIKLIEAKGYLKKSESQPRGICILQEDDSVVEVPLLGIIAAGEPIEAIEDPEPILVPTKMIKTSINYYALKVNGESMIDEGIWNNDIILIKHQQFANKGDIVVAVTDNRATLKEFGGIENGKIKLIPKNPSIPPFFVDRENFEFRGKFVGLLRIA